jgi:tRNA (uracil-5-)-methyltransferase TRM9
MQTQIIQQLNALNQQFYEITAVSFSESRNQPWEGWKELIAPLKKLKSTQPIFVLDVGCGNGRFLEFLQTQFPELSFNYQGIDSNETLLKIAKNSFSASFQKVDIIDSLLKNKSFIHEKYDLIISFGVLHHIPSFSLRKKFLETLSQSLTHDGLFIFSTWNFIESESLMKRAVSADELNFSDCDLEENDYFLTWERGESAVRFCHYVNEAEAKGLIEATELYLLKKFVADGKNHHLNTYYVLQNP